MKTINPHHKHIKHTIGYVVEPGSKGIWLSWRRDLEGVFYFTLFIFAIAVTAMAFKGLIP